MAFMSWWAIPVLSGSSHAEKSKTRRETLVTFYKLAFELKFVSLSGSSLNRLEQAMGTGAVSEAGFAIDTHILLQQHLRPPTLNTRSYTLTSEFHLPKGRIHLVS